MKPRQGPARFAWLAALLAVASLFLRFSEPIFVDHALCEHGEITHRAAPAARAERTSSSKENGPAPERDRDDRHDHCDALAGRCLGSAVAAFVSGASLLLEIPDLDRVAEPADLRRAPLDAAPKTSPPSA